MKRTILVSGIALFFLASCSDNKKEIIVDKPAPIQATQPVAAKPVIEYDSIALDSNKRFEIEYFLINPSEKVNRQRQFARGKFCEEFPIGDFGEKSRKFSYIVPTDGPGHYIDEAGNYISEPTPDYTNFETIVTDTVHHLVIQSNYKVQSHAYCAPGDALIDEYMCTMYDSKDRYIPGMRKITDEARSIWSLQIKEGEEFYPITFTKNGVKMPKKFVETFKKSFKL